MSAENGVYILRTKVRDSKGDGLVNSEQEKYVYRVAYSVNMQDFEFYKEEQYYNLVWFLTTVFEGSHIFESEDEAVSYATGLERKFKYTEHGVSFVQFDGFYPGD